MAQVSPGDERAKKWRLAAAADVRLQAQLTSGVAADQRALVFTALLGAGVVALGGTAGSMTSKTAPDDPFLTYVALAVSLGFIVAMACAVIAARPVPFFMAGAKPSNWSEDFASGKSAPTATDKRAAAATVNWNWSAQAPPTDAGMGLSFGLAGTGAVRLR